MKYSLIYVILFFNAFALELFSQEEQFSPCMTVEYVLNIEGSRIIEPKNVFKLSFDSISNLAETELMNKDFHFVPENYYSIKLYFKVDSLGVIHDITSVSNRSDTESQIKATDLVVDVVKKLITDNSPINNTYLLDKNGHVLDYIVNYTLNIYIGRNPHVRISIRKDDIKNWRSLFIIENE